MKKILFALFFSLILVPASYAGTNVSLQFVPAGTINYYTDTNLGITFMVPQSCKLRAIPTQSNPAPVLRALYDPDKDTLTFRNGKVCPVNRVTYN